MKSLPVFDPSTHHSHPLHGDDVTWPETNCYVDLFVELLHGLGLDPVAGMAFLLSCDFDGEQWEFFKYPPEDLRAVYGIDVREMNAWRPLVEHVERHFSLGHFLTIEADSWFLPDTAGVSYRLGHQKSSICPVAIDAAAEVLHYVHNRGCHRLEGEDFREVMLIDAAPDRLPPYVEVVDISQLDDTAPDERVRALLADHFDRRPSTNPVLRMRDRIEADLPWIQQQDPEVFHGYAFGSLRQFGAWAACASSFSAWLGDTDAALAAIEFDSMSETAKTAQFLLARAARGRAIDLDETFGTMSQAWARGYDLLGNGVT